MPIAIPIAIALLLAGIFFGILGSWTSVPGSQGGHHGLGLAERPSGGDFQLESPAGLLHLANLRGQVVLIYFGYTWCPDICPTNLALIASALKGLTPAELDQVEVLFVTVDPERDDIARLAEYTAYFHPRIRGLSGTPEAIAEVARRYGAAYGRGEQTGSAMGYSIDHSSWTYVVDREGGLDATLPHATAPDQIRAAIRSALERG